MVPPIKEVQHFPKYTGERIVPGVSPPTFLQEHAARYVFAGPLCRNKRVLDVASGLGYGTDYLRTAGAEITGLEIDEESVRYCQRQYPEAEFVCGNAEQLPTHWGTAFDAVVSFETIEHLLHPEKFLDGVFHCLRPGGLFVCSTPNKDLFFLQGANAFHCKEFHSKEFVRFIASRFRVRSVYGQSFRPRWHVVPMVAFSLVRRMMSIVGIRSLGLGAAMTKPGGLSPFAGNEIVENRILPRFRPTEIPTGKIPSFVVVVAEKSSN
jgi:SAM-dependent methyltransferase